MPTVSTLLHLAESYVGTPYLDGEFDCADLAAKVQWDLFGRVIALPQHRRRPRGARGQGGEIMRLRDALATRVDAPFPGCGVLLYSPGDPPAGDVWHIGTVFIGHGETWVLHNSHALGSAALQRLEDLQRWGMRLEGYYAWRDAADGAGEAELMPVLPTPPEPAAAAPKAAAGALVVTPHPLTLQGQRCLPAELVPGEALATFLARHGVERGQQWRVSIGGLAVPEAMWGRVRPQPGQVIEAARVPQKDILRLAAIVALMVYAPELGAKLAGTIGVSQAVGTAIVVTAGNLVINKLLPPSVAKTGSGTSPKETTYSLQGGRNRLRPFEPMGLVLGEPYCVPDLAGQPYTYFASGEQYLWQLFHLGINCAAIAQLRIGQTDIASYSEVTLSRDGFATGNTGLPELAASVDTVAGALLDAATTPGAWVVRTSSVDAVSLAIDLEGALSSLNSRGEYQQITCAIGAEYRLVGSSTWLPLVGGSSTLTLANTGTKPVRVTYQRQVAAGQYEVRLRKESPNATITTDTNTVQWATLKTYQRDSASYDGQARLGVQIRASGQLSGAIDELNCLATAKPMPYWNGSAWVTATSRATGLCNPGAQMLMLARGVFDTGGRLLAGLGLPDDEIDIDSLKLFMVRCAAKGFQFDLYLQENQSIDELLDAIAGAGLGSKSWHTGRLGVVWFAEDQVVEHVQNMASMKLKSFSVDYATAATADEIEFQYFDRERGNAWQSIRVTAPGVTTPTTTARQQLAGVTTEAHASLLARFSMAQNVYQRKSVNFAVDLEHVTFRRGTLMAVSHDVTQWGYGGRLRTASRGAGDIVTLMLDELVPAVSPTGSTSRHIALRLPGELGYRLFGIAAFTGSSRTVTLATAWPAGVPLPGEASDNPAMDTLWIYDFKAAPGQRLRVAEVTPDGNLGGARAVLVPEGPEFWTYVLEGSYSPPPNNSLLVQDLPVVSGLQVTVQRLRQGDTYVIELTVTFDVAGNLGSAQLWAAPQGNALERVGGDIRGTRASLVVQAGTPWVIEIRPFDSLGRAGTPASTTYTVAAAPPAAVVGLGLAVDRVGVLATWQAPSDAQAVAWAATVLRTGASFAAGTQRFAGKATSHNLGWLAAGTTTLWAAHQDTAGEQSTPVSAAISITAPTAPTVTAYPVSVGTVEFRFSDCTASQPLKRVLFRVGTTSDAWAAAADAGAAGADQRSHTVVFSSSGTKRVFLRGEDQAGNLGDITALDVVIDMTGQLQTLLDNALTSSMLGTALRARIDQIEPLRVDADFVMAELLRIEVQRLEPLIADTRTFNQAVSTLYANVLTLGQFASGTRSLIRDAGILVDPSNGRVTISGVEQTQQQLSQVQVLLDAQTASINLKASVAYVDQAIAAAALDPSGLPVFTALDARLTTAELDIDGLAASVTAKADSTTVSSQGARLTTAELDIDGLEGQIALKAATTTVTAIDARLTTAETTLAATTDQASSVRSLTASTYQLSQEAAAAAGNSLAAILAAYASKQANQTALAVFREEIVAKVNTDVSAEVTARSLLGARVGAAEAQIQTEQTVRATQVEALTQITTTQQSSLNANIAAIATEATTRATADAALASQITTLQSSVATNTASITSEATTRANADSALATQVNAVQALADTNAGQILAEQTARADADAVLTRSTQTLTASNFALSKDLDATGASTLAGLAAQHQATTGQRALVAQAREELTSKINADVSAEASSRLELTARVGTTEATLLSEQTTRATADTALSNSLTALQSTVSNNQATVHQPAQHAGHAAGQHGICCNHGTEPDPASAQPGGQQQL